MICENSNSNKSIFLYLGRQWLHTQMCIHAYEHERSAYFSVRVSSSSCTTLVTFLFFSLSLIHILDYLWDTPFCLDVTSMSALPKLLDDDWSKRNAQSSKSLKRKMKWKCVRDEKVFDSDFQITMRIITNHQMDRRTCETLVIDTSNESEDIMRSHYDSCSFFIMILFRGVMWNVEKKHFKKQIHWKEEHKQKHK